MAPPKIYKWPAYVLKDPAVLKLDERGRFIICRLCAEFYAACGGKKPKPIVLNGCYRTRAWEVHKRRTRAHNTSERGRSTSTNLVERVIEAPAANSPRLGQSFGGMVGERSRNTSSLNPGLRSSLVSAVRSIQAPHQSPRPDRRLPVTPPWPPSGIHSAGRSQRASASTETSHRQHQTSTWRMQPAPSLQLTLVFPLVRRSSELRRWSDFDPAWCESCPGYDWRKRPSNRPSSIVRENRTKSRSLPPRSKLYIWPHADLASGAPNEASVPEKSQSNDYAF